MTHSHSNLGEVLPELQPDVLRLYSMRFCPFAQRTRLVLLHKNIPHETINVDLSRKPDWLFQRNPLGLVPILERNEQIVFESVLCNEWLEENYSGGDLAPRDRYEHYKWRNVIAVYDNKVIGPFYGTQLASDGEKREASRARLQKGLNWMETELGDKTFFAGDRVGLVDYSLYPWTERMYNLSEYNVPKLVAWINRMQQLPPVQQTMLPQESHAEFFRQYYLIKTRQSRSINYDFDLPASSKM